MDYQLKLCVLELTNRCNLRCPHCASTSGQKRPYEMSKEEFFRIIDDLAEIGKPAISILGGEFLLAPDWYDICAYIRQKGMEIQLITNGRIVDEAARKKFLELTPQAVAVSIDGASAESFRRQRGWDGFNHCMTLLHDLVRDGHRQVSAITTFSAANINEFDRFAELFMDTPICWQVQFVIKGGERFDERMLLSPKQYEFMAERIAYYFKGEYPKRLKLRVIDDFGHYSMRPEFYKTRQWDGCPGGRRSLGIRSNGECLPCLALGDDFVEANLLETPLKELWNSPTAFYKFRHREEFLTGYCRNCVYSKKCKAGCTGNALSSSNSIGDNHYCLHRMETDRTLAELFHGISAKSQGEPTDETGRN